MRFDGYIYDSLGRTRLAASGQSQSGLRLRAIAEGVGTLELRVRKTAEGPRFTLERASHGYTQIVLDGPLAGGVVGGLDFANYVESLMPGVKEAYAMHVRMVDSAFNK